MQNSRTATSTFDYHRQIGTTKEVARKIHAESKVSPEESSEWEEQNPGNFHLHPDSHLIPGRDTKQAKGGDRSYCHQDKKVPYHAWRFHPKSSTLGLYAKWKKAG